MEPSYQTVDLWVNSPIVIIADPRGQSGGQPNPDLFHRTLRGCRPGSNVSCCFDNGGLTPPSQWFFTLYGWINSDRSCRSNLEQTTSPTDIEPPLADEIVLYSGIDNAFLTTAGLRGQIRVLHVHDTKHHHQGDLRAGAQHLRIQQEQPEGKVQPYQVS